MSRALRALMAALSALLACASVPADHFGPAIAEAEVALSEQDFARALAVFEHALAIARSEHGALSPEALHATEQLAYLNQNLGRLSEAERRHRQVLPLTDAVSPADAERRANARSNVASILNLLQRPVEAERFAREAMALLPASARDSATAAIVLANLANSVRLQGRSSEALPLLDEAVPLLERHFGVDSPHVTSARITLASVLAAEGRAGEARTLCESELPRLRELLPREHPAMTQLLEDCSF